MGRKPTRTIGWAAVVAATLVGLVLTARSRAEGEKELGVWISLAADGGQAAIERAIVDGTEPMPPVRQRVARRRLFESNPPVHRLEVTREGNLAIARFNPGGEHAFEYRAPIGGAARSNRGPDGRPVDVTYRFDENGLFRARMATRDGNGEAVYRVRGDRLVVAVTIRSSHLPAPIRYDLRFRRSAR